MPSSARLPLLVAHRGGTGDAPENTLQAINKALSNGAEAIWLSVQLSKDGVPILYRPADLSTLTNVSGPVLDRTMAELVQVNAGWHFKNADGGYPYREHSVGIPTLRRALQALPPGMPVMLDMKSLPAEPLAQAVAQVLTEEKAWSRTLLYSTDVRFQQAFSKYGQAQLFESRDATRDRLAKVLLNEGCESAPIGTDWVAFELHRKLEVIETFTLGQGISKVNATLWTPETVACFRQQSRVNILAIAVNSVQDFRIAACLGVDAVLVDSPKPFAVFKAEWKSRPFSCSKDEITQ
jgi:glycerophosphoryl diester phosphodiesterase